MARVWAASLHAGPGAVLSGGTALWLAGAVDAMPAVIQVCVPHGRSVLAVPGVGIVGSRRLLGQTQPAAQPTRMHVEDALLAQVEVMRSSGEVVGLVLQVLQRRATTGDRLRSAAAGRGRLRWRALILDLTDEAAQGVQSRLESRFRRDVERAHGLPRGDRNAAEVAPQPPFGAASTHGPGKGERVGERVGERDGDRSWDGQGRVRYRDVRYRRYGLVVELDGRLAHPVETAWRDRWRDNDTVIEGDRTVRYGWHEVAAMPCSVAVQVVAALRVGGWRGTARACGSRCAVAAQATDRPA